MVRSRCAITGQALVGLLYALDERTCRGRTPFWTGIGTKMGMADRAKSDLHYRYFHRGWGNAQPRPDLVAGDPTWRRRGKGGALVGSHVTPSAAAHRRLPEITCTRDAAFRNERYARRWRGEHQLTSVRRCKHHCRRRLHHARAHSPFAQLDDSSVMEATARAGAHRHGDGNPFAALLHQALLEGAIRVAGN